jgi:hypothetical protein
MIGLYFLLGALAVLVIILFFGFVGCADLVEGSPQYSACVKETPGLVAYWRLGELSSDEPAKDEIGGFDGNYFTLDTAEEDVDFHSPATTGTITPGAPGLLVEEQKSFSVDGGGVRVPFNNNLNPFDFTFEAWVDLFDFGYDERFFYCLVESAGPPGLGQKKRGWGLYLGPDDPDNPPDDPSGLRWQVWMGDGDQFKRVAIAKPDFPTDSQGNVITPLTLTYLALTFNFDEKKLQLWLFVPNTDQVAEEGINLPDSFQALEADPSISFLRNDPDEDGQGDFFIGTGSNLFPDAGTPNQRLYPLKGRIQEVALYDKDLSEEENGGVIFSLLDHFMCAQKD